MSIRFPYSKQTIDQTDADAVAAAMIGDRISQGQALETFEEALRKKTGARYAVVFSSGTAALHCAWMILKNESPTLNTVISSPITFASTHTMALQSGFNLELIDTLGHHGHMHPHHLEERCSTQRYAGIAAISMGGHPFPTEIKHIAQKHEIPLLSDHAHSLGGLHKNNDRLSSIVQPDEHELSVISFQAVKTITTGEGGALLTQRKDWAAFAYSFRTLGLVKSPEKWKRKGKQPLWYHEMQFPGMNYRMNEMQAALGISQLDKIDRFTKQRERLAQEYERLLGNHPLIKLPPRTTEQPAWHLFVIHAPHRDELMQRLALQGIGTQLHYQPSTNHPWMAAQPISTPFGIRNAESYAQTALSIPLYPELTIEDVGYISTMIIQELEILNSH